jgi:hypothetical protein
VESELDADFVVLRCQYNKKLAVDNRGSVWRGMGSDRNLQPKGSREKQARDLSRSWRSSNYEPG